MKRKRNGLIRLENVLMASIAVVALAVCAAPFFNTTTESWGVAREQFVRTAPIGQRATVPVPLLPRELDVPLTVQAATDPAPVLNTARCTCVSPREQAMERLRRLRTCRADATPTCS